MQFEDDILEQSKLWANTEIAEVIKDVITSFEAYNISPESLIILSKIFALTSSYDLYQIKGYIQFTIAEKASTGDLSFMEITIDEDGLRLTTGGYEMNEYGGDSYSEEIFPIWDEDEALDTMSILEGFKNDLNNLLFKKDIEIELIDCLDKMELTEESTNDPFEFND